MIKTIKNELNKEKKPTLTVKTAKPKQPFLINKPLIYHKVVEQRIREKIENEFLLKKVFFLKKKYFYKLKFFYKNSIFFKKQNLRILNKFLFKLVKATTMIKNKNKNIQKYYKNLFKLKIFYAWAKQTRIMINTKLTRKSFRNTIINSFLKKLKSIRNIRKILFQKKKYCFAKLIFFKFHRILQQKYEKCKLFNRTEKNYKLFLYRKLFGKILKKSFYLQTLYQKFKIFFKRCFLLKLKSQIYKKKLQKLVIIINKKRIFFNSFKTSFKKFRKSKLKYRITTNFHNEYIKLAFFHKMIQSKKIVIKLKNMIKSYYKNKRNYYKSSLMEIFNDTKEKNKKIRLQCTILKFNYFTRNLQSFLKILRDKINLNNKDYLAKNYYNDKIIFNTFQIISHTLTRRLKLKNFIEKLKMNFFIKLKKGYVQILKYKSGIPINTKENFFYQKYREISLEKKIRKYMISKLSNVFFRNLKYIKKKQIKKNRKMKILNAFYLRKLVLSSFSAFVNFRKYQLIKKRNHFLLTLKTLKFAKKLKEIKENSNYLKNKYDKVNSARFLRVVVLSIFIYEIRKNNSLYNVNYLYVLKRTFLNTEFIKTLNTKPTISKITQGCVFLILIMNSLYSKLKYSFTKIKNKYNLFKLEKKISNYYIKNMIATILIIKDTKNKYRLKLDQIKKLVISKNNSNENSSI